jgi:hypothetical protein
MEQPTNRAGKPTIMEVTKRLTVGALFLAGIVSLGVILLLLTLTFLPNTRFKSEAFQEIKALVDAVLNKLETAKGGGAPTPDSPIVVSGGSLNFFANSTSVSAWLDYNNKGYLYYANAGSVPNSLYIDGIYPMPITTGSYPYPEQTTISTSTTGYNWAITLTFRNKDASGNPSLVYICSALTTEKGRPVCDTTASGSIGGNNFVYIQADPNTLSNAQVDQQNPNARLHYAVPMCTVADASRCDKIDNMVVQQGPSSASKYKCVDGTCRIEISNAP